MHYEDWYDDGVDAAIEEAVQAAQDFNSGVSYNPFDWIAWVLTDHGDVSIYVESGDGKFIARFSNAPADELRLFMQRLEESLQ